MEIERVLIIDFISLSLLYFFFLIPQPTLIMSSLFSLSLHSCHEKSNAFQTQSKFTPLMKVCYLTGTDMESVESLRVLFLLFCFKEGWLMGAKGRKIWRESYCLIPK